MDTPRGKVTFVECCQEERQIVADHETRRRREIEEMCDDFFLPWVSATLLWMGAQQRHDRLVTNHLEELCTFTEDGTFSHATQCSSKTANELLAADCQPLDRIRRIRGAFVSCAEHRYDVEKELESLRVRFQTFADDAVRERAMHIELISESELRYEALLAHSENAFEASGLARDEAAFWQDTASRQSVELDVLRRCLCASLVDLAFVGSEGETVRVADVDLSPVATENNTTEHLSTRVLLLECIQCTPHDSSNVAALLLAYYAATMQLWCSEAQQRGTLQGAWSTCLFACDVQLRHSVDAVNEAMAEAATLLQAQQDHCSSLQRQLEQTERSLSDAESRLASEQLLRESEVSTLWDLLVSEQQTVEAIRNAQRSVAPVPRVDAAAEATTQYDARDLLRTSTIVGRRRHPGSTQRPSVPSTPQTVIFRRFKQLRELPWSAVLPNVCFLCSKYPNSPTATAPNATVPTTHRICSIRDAASAANLAMSFSTLPPMLDVEALAASPTAKRVASSQPSAGAFFLVLDFLASQVRVHPCGSRESATPRVLHSHDLLHVTRSVDDTSKLTILLTNGYFKCYCRNAFERERCIELLRCLTDVYDGVGYSEQMLPSALQRQPDTCSSPSTAWDAASLGALETPQHLTVETVIEMPARTHVQQHSDMSELQYTLGGVDSQTGALLLDTDEGRQPIDGLPEIADSPHHLSPLSQSQRLRVFNGQQPVRRTFALHFATSHWQPVNMIVLEATVPQLQCADLNFIPVELVADPLCHTVDLFVLRLVLDVSLRSADRTPLVDLHLGRILHEYVGVDDYILALNVEEEEENTVYLVLVKNTLLGCLHRMNCSKSESKSHSAASEVTVVSFDVNETSFAVLFAGTSSTLCNVQHGVQCAPEEVDVHCAATYFFVVRSLPAPHACQIRDVAPSKASLVQWCTRESLVSMYCQAAKQAPRGSSHDVSSRVRCVSFIGNSGELGSGGRPPLASVPSVHHVTVVTQRCHATAFDVAFPPLTTEGGDASTVPWRPSVRVDYNPFVLRVRRVQLRLFAFATIAGHYDANTALPFSRQQWESYSSDERDKIVWFRSEMETQPRAVRLSRVPLQQYEKVVAADFVGGVPELQMMVYCVNCMDCLVDKLTYLVDELPSHRTAPDAASSPRVALPATLTANGSASASPVLWHSGESKVEHCLPWFIRGVRVGEVAITARLSRLLDSSGDN